MPFVVEVDGGSGIAYLVDKPNGPGKSTKYNKTRSYKISLTTVIWVLHFGCNAQVNAWFADGYNRSMV